jgi:hypothetical protein
MPAMKSKLDPELVLALDKFDPTVFRRRFPEEDTPDFLVTKSSF